MSFRYQKITAATTVLVTLAVAQVYVGVTFAGPSPGPRVSEAVPAPLFGILTTSDKKPITVNGASAVTGATIPTGSVVETPDKVGATIRLGPLGSICIAPNTKLTLEYDRHGNLGSVKVNLTEGCVILRTLKDSGGTIISPQGVVGQTSGATGGSIDVCVKPGAAPMLNQGAAVDAGAGASAVDCGAAGAAAAPGFPKLALIPIIAAGAILPIVLFTGGNPSP